MPIFYVKNNDKFMFGIKTPVRSIYHLYKDIAKELGHDDFYLESEYGCLLEVADQYADHFDADAEIDIVILHLYKPQFSYKRLRLPLEQEMPHAAESHSSSWSEIVQKIGRGIVRYFI